MCNKIGRTLLDGQLTRISWRHLISVPLETLAIVLLAVKEVHLSGRRSNGWIDFEKPGQSSGATLSGSDDDGLREAPFFRRINPRNGRVVSPLSFGWVLVRFVKICK